MYSPSARLTELISSYLGDFFQSVEKDHLQVRGMHWLERPGKEGLLVPCLLTRKPVIDSTIHSWAFGKGISAFRTCASARMPSSSSGPMPRSPCTKASWERFVSRWVSCFCVSLYPFFLSQSLHTRPDVSSHLSSKHWTHECFIHVNLRQIPWGSLTTGKASLILHNVKLCLHPRAVDGPPTPDVLHAMEAAAQLAKQAIVQRAEEELYNLKGKNAEAASSPTMCVDQSFTRVPTSHHPERTNVQATPPAGPGDRLSSRPLPHRC